jgi:hypothetical protein
MDMEMDREKVTKMMMEWEKVTKVATKTETDTKVATKMDMEIEKVMEMMMEIEKVMELAKMMMTDMDRIFKDEFTKHHINQIIYVLSYGITDNFTKFLLDENYTEKHLHESIKDFLLDTVANIPKDCNFKLQKYRQTFFKRELKQFEQTYKNFKKFCDGDDSRSITKHKIVYDNCDVDPNIVIQAGEVLYKTLTDLRKKSIHKNKGEKL